jgi:hypothetical protein
MRPEPEYQRGLIYQLGLQGDKAKRYSLWEQLCREIIIHMKTREFREEFL